MLLVNIILTICLTEAIASPLTPRSQIISPTSLQDDYLLPSNVIPLSYEIELEPDLENEVFNGSVVINIYVQSETDTITLHTRDLEIEENSEAIVIIDINSPGDSPIYTNATFSNDDRDFYTIALDKSIEAGKTYQLSIRNFTGNLNRLNAGFYIAEYETEDGETRKFATTQFESTDARRAFPSFDEPALKANFTIKIIRTSEFNSVSNMPIVVEGEEVTPGRFRDTFETSPKMSSYLVAFVVSDYVTTDFVGYGRVIASSDAISQGWGDWALSVAPKVIDSLANFTNFPFMLEKIDQIAIPRRFYSAGAMENWGLVTYLDSYLLYVEDSDFSSSQAGICTIISHEYGHQWFGDLVSPKWWSYLWLNEGFATYFETFTSDEVNPEWGLAGRFAVDVLQNALFSDSREVTHAMNADVGSPIEIESIFDGISYGKAGSVIRMAETFLTTPVFKSGLSKYLNKMQYSAAEPKDLFDSWHEAVEESGRNLLPSGRTVDDVMSSWADVEGYPVVNVSVNYDSKLIIFSQNRFLLESPVDESSNFSIAINYAIADSADFEDTSTDFWLVSSLNSVADNSISEDQWIIVNKQQRGYFRVNYDEANWLLLIDYLHSDQFENIHVVNRAQLVDDSDNLADSGRLDPSIALQIADYISRETEYAPIASFLKSTVKNLNTKLSTSPSYSLFKSWVVQSLRTAFEKLGLTPRIDDTYSDVINRENVLYWMCKFGESECRDEATKHFTLWKTEDVKIKASFDKPFICGAMTTASAEDWDFLLLKYEEETNPIRAQNILLGLSCSESEAQLQKYLTWITDVNNKLTLEQRTIALQAMYNAGPLGHDVILRQMKNKSVDKSFTDILHSNKGVNQPVITSINSSLKWRNEHLSKVESWFQERQNK